MPLPQMIQSLSVKDDDGIRLLREFDATQGVLHACLNHPGAVELWLEGRRADVGSLGLRLTAEENALRLKGKLVLTGFQRNLISFLSQVPDGQHQRALFDHLRKIETAELRLTLRKNLWEQISEARMATPRDGSPLLLPETDDVFVESCEEALEYLSEEKDVDLMGMSLAELRRLNVCPFLYATKKHPWGEGIRAEDVREIYENEGEITVSTIENMLECAAVDHYEEAYYDLVDVDDLRQTLYLWAKKQAAGEGDDFGLEEKLAAWNAKQTIVSYYADCKIIVPLMPEVTHATAVQWCADQVREAEEQLESLRAQGLDFENTANDLVP